MAEFQWTDGVYNRAKWPRVNLWITYCDRRESAGVKQNLAKLGARARTNAAKALQLRALKERDLRIAVERGLPLDLPEPRGKTPTFASLVTPWAEDRATRTKKNGDPEWRAGKRVRREVEMYLTPYLGALPIDQVDVYEVRKLARTLRTQHNQSKASVRRIFASLSAFMNEIRSEHRELAMLPNPVSLLGKSFKRQNLKSDHDPKLSPWIKSEQHWAALYNQLPEPVRQLYACCSLAGLRTGEALALRPEDVDLERRVITIERSKDPDQRCAVKPPKSGDLRVVPILGPLHDILDDWMKRRPRGQWLFPRIRSKVRDEDVLRELAQTGGNKREVARRLGVHHQTIYAWCRRGGNVCDEMMCHGYVGKTMKEAFVALGMPPMHLHNAGRHTFASHFAMDTGDLSALQDILGHSALYVTELYRHLCQGRFNKRTRAAMQSFDPSQCRTVSFTKPSQPAKSKKGGSRKTA